MGVGAPSGTVTYLFTDIEGSTRLWQQGEGAMRAAVFRRHDELLRAAITVGGGTIFSTMGDGFPAAAFPTAHAAVRAAQSAQAMLSREEWSTAESLHVRIGLHSGEAEEFDGDYFGTVVNRAAAGCHGHAAARRSDLVLLRHSRTARGECGHDDGFRASIVRDVGGECARVPDRRGAVPAAAVAGPRAGNSPVQASSFVGRRHELDEVSAALFGCSLVTLAGVGGVGKTRLALGTSGGAGHGVPRGCVLGGTCCGGRSPPVRCLTWWPRCWG